MSLHNNIHSWIQHNNKIQELQKELTTLRKEKTIKEHNIIELARSNNILDNHIKIDSGLLKFQNSNRYSPLTLQYIKECLANFIDNSEHIYLILAYIKENRTITSKINIKYSNA